MLQLNTVEETFAGRENVKILLQRKGLKRVPHLCIIAHGSIGSRRSVRGTRRGASVNVPRGMRVEKLELRSLRSFAQRSAVRIIIKYTRAGSAGGVGVYILFFART